MHEECSYCHCKYHNTDENGHCDKCAALFDSSALLEKLERLLRAGWSFERHVSGVVEMHGPCCETGRRYIACPDLAGAIRAAEE